MIKQHIHSEIGIEKRTKPEIFEPASQQLYKKGTLAQKKFNESDYKSQKINTRSID